MKFLIIRFSSIGDIVLTTPVIRCIKQQVSGATVHFLTKKNFRGIVETNPYVDKVMILNESWELLMHELQMGEYDYIIDLHHNLRTLKVKRGLKGVKSFSFNKLNIQKWLLTALKINRLPKVHIVDRYLDTVKELGVVNDGKGLDYFIPVKDTISEKDIPLSHWYGYIGIVIGAAHNTKKLPVHKLKELCEKITYPIILLGGKEDSANGDEIASLDDIRIYNACGKFNLNESAGLVKRSKLIITHDTGLMHIAAAFQKPIISVWGNTVPEFGMWAYGMRDGGGEMRDEGYEMRDAGYGMRDGGYEIRDTRFEIKGLRCRPCTKIGYDKCPKGHFKCMELQDIEQMARTAVEIVLKQKTL